MLIINIPEQELWDEKNQRFIKINPTRLELENSLYAISNWESKWCKSFFISDEKSEEETIDYIKQMTLNEVDDVVYKCIDRQTFDEIKKYINLPMTATKINSKKNQNNNRSSSYITSEIIYYMMLTLNIPPEYDRWHINKLITLIRVCQIKSQPPKKMSQQEAIAYQARMNAERRAKLNSKG